MGLSATQCENTYRLVAAPSREAGEPFLEFEAAHEEAVFRAAARHFLNQNIEVYSGGRARCRLFAPVEGGYWVINPPWGAPRAVLT